MTVNTLLVPGNPPRLRISPETPLEIMALEQFMQVQPSYYVAKSDGSAVVIDCVAGPANTPPQPTPPAPVAAK